MARWLLFVACLVIAIAVGVVFGVQFGVSREEAVVAARPTQTPAVVIPTPSGPQIAAYVRTVFAQTAATARAAPSATPEPTGTALPTETPLPIDKAAGVHVVMSTKHVPDAPPFAITTVFRHSVVRVWCVAEFPSLHTTDTVSFRWMSHSLSALLLNYNMPSVKSAVAKTYKAAYIDGPLPSGPYSCDVWLNDHAVGSAPFTVQ